MCMYMTTVDQSSIIIDNNKKDHSSYHIIPCSTSNESKNIGTIFYKKKILFLTNIWFINNVYNY